MGAPAVRTALAFRPLVWLGEHTFALYLLHFPILCSLGCASYVFVARNLGDQAGFVAGVGATIVCSLGTAIPFTRWVDKPAQALACRLGGWLSLIRSDRIRDAR